MSATYSFFLKPLNNYYSVEIGLIVGGKALVY